MVVLEVAQRAEERRQDAVGVLLGGVHDAPGDEVGRVLQREDEALDDLVHPQGELLLGGHEEDRQAAEAPQDRLQAPLGARRVPVGQHPGERGVRADHRQRVLDPVGPAQLHAEPAHRRADAADLLGERRVGVGTLRDRGENRSFHASSMAGGTMRFEAGDRDGFRTEGPRLGRRPGLAQDRWSGRPGGRSGGRRGASARRGPSPPARTSGSAARSGRAGP